MKWFSLTLFISILFGYFSASAQPFNVSLNQGFNVELERQLLLIDSLQTGSFKPINYNHLKHSEGPFSAIRLKLMNSKSFIARKLFHEHLITLDTGEIRLTIDPLFNFEYGRELEVDPRDINLYKNTRGFNLKLGIGDKLAIESSFRENQTNLPLYLSQRTRANQVAYGQGRVKTFKKDGFDFAMASAYVSYSPNQRLNIQAGHGKHFVGSGHRSLLLSDLSFNYPFLRLNSNWFDQKLQYQNVFALLQNLNRLPSNTNSESLFERKRATFHYLEYKPNRIFSVGLFEGIVYPSLDTTGNRSVGVNYWVPAIFLNSLVEGSKQGGNSLIGVNLELNLFKQLKLYQQFAFPDEQLKEMGFQSGFKWFLNRSLMFQMELNNINMGGITNRYNHYNESLTHPYEERTVEALAIVYFQKNRWQSRLATNYLELESKEILFFDIRQSFIVNPSYHFTFNIGLQVRSDAMVNPIETTVNGSTYFYVGLSTNLQNIYFNY